MKKNAAAIFKLFILLNLLILALISMPEKSNATELPLVENHFSRP